MRLTSFSDTLRGRDESALVLLATLLDSAGTKNQLSGELWSAVVRRFLRDQYPREKDQRLFWMAVHFHARQLATQELVAASAEEVVKVWAQSGFKIGSPATIKAIAQRKDMRKKALERIDVWLKQATLACKLAHPPSTVDEKSVYTSIVEAMPEIASEYDFRKASRSRSASLTVKLAPTK